MGAQRRMLTETAAGRAQEYPDVKLTHEVLTGHPVECLAEAAESALALVGGRRGRGGYTGIRLGSVPTGCCTARIALSSQSRAGERALRPC